MGLAVDITMGHAVDIAVALAAEVSVEHVITTAVDSAIGACRRPCRGSWRGDFREACRRFVLLGALKTPAHHSYTRRWPENATNMQLDYCQRT